MNKKILSTSVMLVLLLSILSTIAPTTVRSEGNGYDPLVVVKEVFDGNDWVDTMDAEKGDTIQFRVNITYHNATEPGRHYARDMIVTDTLPPCLEYEEGSAHPAVTNVTDNVLVWDLGTAKLFDNETISIVFNASVVGYGVDVSLVVITADEFCTPIDLYDEDAVTITISEPVAIGDFVWDDLNNDGIQDAGEPGISNVTVNLYDIDDNLVATATTDLNGGYLFAIHPGCYYVKFVLPLGYVFTLQDVGNNTSDSDADPLTGQTAIVCLDFDQRDLTIDAGMYPLGSIDLELRKQVYVETDEYGGCSPGFWKNHQDYWVNYLPGDTIEDVFDIPAELSELASKSLLEALRFKGGPSIVEAAQILLRQAIAAVLNSAHPEVNYPLSVTEVIGLVNDALASLDRETLLSLKDTLDGYNNLGCTVVEEDDCDCDQDECTFTFVLSVFNNGTGDATGIEVTDVLPAGISFVSAESNNGSYDPATGVWHVGNLSAGVTATLEIITETDIAGTYTNIAEVTAAGQLDVDSTPNNHDPSEDDQDSVIFTCPLDDDDTGDDDTGDDDDDDAGDDDDSGDDDDDTGDDDTGDDDDDTGDDDTGDDDDDTGDNDDNDAGDDDDSGDDDDDTGDDDAGDDDENDGSSSSSGNSGHNGGGSAPNQPPVADASAGEPHTGFIDEEITFNGSNSYDPDGEITEWFWNFGDGTNGTGEIILHTYSNPDIYTVTLTVTDDKGDKDTYETTAVINQPNRPPTAPVVEGATSGNIDTEYSFIAVSTDLDNDNIRYIFDWGDGTITTTDFLANGTVTTQNHAWASSGEHIILVQAYDNKTYSGATELTVLIDDAPYVAAIGDMNYGAIILAIIMMIEIISFTAQIQREKLKGKKQGCNSIYKRDSRRLIIKHSHFLLIGRWSNNS